MSVPLIESDESGGYLQINELSHVQPEAFQEFQHGLVRDPAFFLILFIKRIEVLVHSPVADNGAGFLLKAGKDLCHPLGLHRFPETEGRILRNS